MRGKGALPKSLIWAGAAGIGAIGGLLLGNFVVGQEVTPGSEYGSYAEVTGNPDALGVSSAFGEPCYDCGPGYGAAMPKMAANDARMDHAFRELGTVEIDYSSPSADDYAYGGRFDDPAAARTIVMQSPVPVEVAASAIDAPPPAIATVAVAPEGEQPPSPPDATVD
jgi:hypothetical protein